MKKTLKQWENKNDEQSLDEWLKPMQEIDELLYHHINNGYVASRFSANIIENGVRKLYNQAGECLTEVDGVKYYATTVMIGEKCYYLGNLPNFKQAKY